MIGWLLGGLLSRLRALGSCGGVPENAKRMTIEDATGIIVTSQNETLSWITEVQAQLRESRREALASYHKKEMIHARACVRSSIQQEYLLRALKLMLEETMSQRTTIVGIKIARANQTTQTRLMAAINIVGSNGAPRPVTTSSYQNPPEALDGLIDVVSSTTAAPSILEAMKRPVNDRDIDVVIGRLVDNDANVEADFLAGESGYAGAAQARAATKPSPSPPPITTTTKNSARNGKSTHSSSRHAVVTLPPASELALIPRAPSDDVQLDPSTIIIPRPAFDLVRADGVSTNA
jgi:hypothetical protein